jgi:hypothetical protein
MTAVGSKAAPATGRKQRRMSGSARLLIYVNFPCDSFKNLNGTYPSHERAGMKRLIILVAATMLEASPTPAAAGPWCLSGEITDCYQPTFEMCNYVARGEGGSCGPNPNYADHSKAYAATFLLPGRALRVRYEQAPVVAPIYWWSAYAPQRVLIAATRAKHSAPRALTATNGIPTDKVEPGCSEAAGSILDIARDHVPCPAEASSTPVQTVARTKQQISSALTSFAMADGIAGINVGSDCRQPTNGNIDGVQDKARCVTDASSAPVQTATRTKQTIGVRVPAPPADAVPMVDIQKTCRNAAEVTSRLLGSGSVQNDFDVCLGSEQTAREQIVKDWGTYSSPDKARCVRSTVYLPSYVEWLTCLEMERDVRKMRAEQRSLTAGR